VVTGRRGGKKLKQFMIPGGAEHASERRGRNWFVVCLEEFPQAAGHQWERKERIKSGKRRGKPVWEPERAVRYFRSGGS